VRHDERRRATMTTILVGTDTSAAADLAVEDAARLARERGAELLVLYVKPDGDARAVVDPDRAADPRAHLQRLAARFPGIHASTRIEDGDPAERICDIAAEVRAETIVLGNRGTQGSRWHVRESVPNLVLRHAPCSVYIVDTRRAQ
jgi:nucleotide-binding universal stress UspA family protein